MHSILKQILEENMARIAAGIPREFTLDDFESARTNRSYSHQILSELKVRTDILPVYLVLCLVMAEDWIAWINNPNLPSAPKGVLWAYMDVTDLPSFRSYAEYFREALTENMEKVNALFAKIGRGKLSWEDDDPKSIKNVFRACRVTARIFAEQGDFHFNEMLDANGVPSLEEIEKQL